MGYFKLYTGKAVYWTTMILNGIGLIIALLMLLDPLVPFLSVNTMVGAYLLILGISSIVIAFSGVSHMTGRATPTTKEGFRGDFLPPLREQVREAVVSLFVRTARISDVPTQNALLMLSEKTLDGCLDYEGSFAAHHIDIHLSPHSGTLIYHAIKEQNPDAVLLDVFLPGMDALAIKKQYDQNCPDCDVVFYATGPFYSDAIIKELIDAGFAYYFMRPFDVESLSDRICQRSAPAAEAALTDTVDQAVTGMLRELGMPSHILGFHFVRQAILMMSADPGRYGLGAVTIHLYPDIAEDNGTTVSRVERAIRYAIEVSFGRCSRDILGAFFGSTARDKAGKATNSEFIAALVDRVSLTNPEKSTKVR